MRTDDMKRTTAVLILLAVTCTAWGGSKTNYKNEIESNTVNLRAVQKSIKEKRLEKERLLLEEKSIRRELTRIQKEMNRLQKESEKLRREIIVAEKKLKAAQKAATVAENEKIQWASLIEREADLWYRSHRSCEQLFREPVTEKLRFQALTQKKIYYSDAQTRESVSRDNMAQWKTAQATLLKLKGKRDKTAREQADVRKQKQELLKTATGRRIVAEEDITRLLESARALQQLIIKLERERKESQSKGRDKQRPRTTVQKRQFPWPMNGQVVTRFGKNKHPELDTIVISNGIKIQGTPGAEVRVIDDGDVVFSGEFRSYGLMAIVDHGGGIYSIYGQLGKISVQEDQKMKAGAPVGTLPSEDKPLLYFEIRSDGQPEDPLQWLK